MSNSTSSGAAAAVPVTSEEFLQRSSSWTLACDNAVLNRLKAFSEKVSRQSQEILQECDNLSTEIDLLNVRVQTVTNEFLILSNTQFTENRVEEFQEMLTTHPTNQNVPMKTKAEKELELIAKMKEAIKIGVAVKSQQQLKRDNLHGAPAPYAIKKLPHIIGTPKFFSSRYCGLVDEINFQQGTAKSITEDEDIEPNGEDVQSTAITPSDIHVVVASNPEPQSFTNPAKHTTKNGHFEDIFFPSRELYVPPTDKSLYKEGSPSSDDQFIHRRTPSTAASSSSNLAPESERKEGSDTSSISENKPHTESNARHTLPPPIIDTNSDDSDDDFRPLEPGKGLAKSIFADEDDDEMFGNNSLFRSSASAGANEDLFFNKPPNINSLFGQNARPTPVMLPSVPPPISPSKAPPAQRATPPTLHSRDSDTKQAQSTDKDTVTSEIESRHITSISDTLNKHFLENPIRPIPNEEVDNPVARNHNHSESRTQVERAKPEPESVTKVDNASSLPSLHTETAGPATEKHVKEVFDPLPGKSFVKSMALGLKIDPAALNPGAKFPARRASPIQNLPDDSPQMESVDQNEVREQSLPKPPAQEGRSDLNNAENSEVDKTTRNPMRQSSVVKTIAAEIKINPSALMPGMKPPARHDSIPANSTVIESAQTQVISTERVKDSDDRILPPQEKAPAYKTSGSSSVAPKSNTPQIEVAKSPVGTETAKPDAPIPIPTPRSMKVKSSIFDGDSSDDDLFSPKSSSINQSQKQNTNSLFAEKSQDWISTRSASAKAKGHGSSSEVADKQNLKSQIQRSIFQDSDSDDDDLFGTKSINTKKTPILFSEGKNDDIFSAKLNSNDSNADGTSSKLEQADGKQSDKLPDDVKLSTSLGVENATGKKNKITPSQTLPTQSQLPAKRPVSPLFSNEVDSDELNPESSISTQHIKKPLPQTVSSQKLFTGKSIFGDSDSDDEDLFKPSTKNKTLSKGPAKTVVSENTTGPVVSPPFQDAQKFSGSSEKKPVKKELEDSRSTAVDNSSASSARSREIGIAGSSIWEREGKSEHNLSLSEDDIAENASEWSVVAAKPKLEVLFPTMTTTSKAAQSAKPTENLDYEQGISFDDPVSSSLLPNVVKSRPKASARRPPTRKVAQASREPSDDMSTSATLLTSEEDDTEVSWKPMGMDQSE